MRKGSARRILHELTAPVSSTSHEQSRAVIDFTFLSRGKGPFRGRVEKEGVSWDLRDRFYDPQMSRPLQFLYRALPGIAAVIPVGKKRNH
jgi:hypothetical protein